MINVNTDKLIVVMFPANSGGKFLMTALGLSDSVILPIADIHQANSLDKLQYLEEKINEKMFDGMISDSIQIYFIILVFPLS